MKKIESNNNIDLQYQVIHNNIANLLNVPVDLIDGRIRQDLGQKYINGVLRSHYGCQTTERLKYIVLKGIEHKIYSLADLR